MKKIILIGLFFVALFAAFGLTLMILEINRFNFRAESINGEISFNDLKGVKKIIYFGYTSCPDICPLTLDILKQALDEINKDILLIFISLDERRDTPEILQEYVEFFHTNALGLRLNSDELNKVAKNYGIKYEQIPLKDSALGYSIAHSSALFFFDENNKLIAKITNLTKEKIKNAIQ